MTDKGDSWAYVTPGTPNFPERQGDRKAEEASGSPCLQPQGDSGYRQLDQTGAEGSPG